MASRACRNSCGEYFGSVDVDELCCKKIEPTGLRQTPCWSDELEAEAG